MSKTLKQHLPLILIAILFLSLCFIVGFGLNSNIALAAEDSINSSVEKETLTIAQISDIHYFSLDYCYAYYKDKDGNIKFLDRTSDSYKKSDFNTDTYGDTKLVPESGATYAATIKKFIDFAKEAAESGDKDKINAVPDILLATGDFSKNSERIALIDVANGLRLIQEQMRLIKKNDSYPFKNFQVLAVPGNHDLYNGNCSVYMNQDTAAGKHADGHSSLTDTVDVATFAQIFESLGYPTFNPSKQVTTIDTSKFTEDGDTYTGGKLATDNSFWWSDFTGKYIHSSNAKNLKITYYQDKFREIADAVTTNEDAKTDAKYDELNEDTNALSYIVEIFQDDDKTTSTGYTAIMMDTSDRIPADKKIVCTVASVPQINNISNNNIHDYCTLNSDGSKYIMFNDIDDLYDAIKNNKTIYRSTGLDHITGGRVSMAALDWLKNYINTDKTNLNNQLNKDNLNDYQETYFIITHQNLLPHFDMEDDILKDFTLYNWEYTVKRLLSMGIRYAFTGHMHTSDMQCYADSQGRVFYDFQTGSLISYSSPIRRVEIERLYTTNKKLVEDVHSTLDILDNFAEIPSNNIAETIFGKTPTTWNDVDVTGKSKEEAFNARKNANPNYLTYCIFYDDLRNKDNTPKQYNDYIANLIYNPLLNRMLKNFLSEKMIGKLKGMASNFLLNDFKEMAETALGGMLSNYATYGSTLAPIADSLIDQIVNDLDYTLIANMNGKKCQSKEIIGFLNEIVTPFLELKFGKDDTTNHIRKLNVYEVVSQIIKRHNTGIEIQGADKVKNPELNTRPEDKEYAYALKDFCEQVHNGTLIDKLLHAVLDPLLSQENSVIKQLYYHQFDLTAVRNAMNDKNKEQFDDVFNLLKTKINDKIAPNDFKLTYVLENSMVSGLVNSLIQKLGTDMNGMNIIEFAEDFIGKYMTESLYVNLGGYVEQIAMAFATDETADIVPIDEAITALGGNYTQEKHAELTTHLRYTNKNGDNFEYSKIGETEYTFVEGQPVPDAKNIATVKNGRLPGQFNAAFDNNKPTTTFKIKFYTAEEVFPMIQIFDENGDFITSVSTLDNPTTSTDSTTYKMVDGKYLNKYSKTSEENSSNITVNIDTLVTPCYVPLIDLGILCLTHGQVDYKVKADDKIEYTVPAEERDIDLKNSVMFYNQNTITISGLTPDKTYKYRVYGVTNGIEGEKSISDTTRYFSLTDYVYNVKNNPSTADYNVTPTTTKLTASDKVFSFRTAMAENPDAKFEFLAVADPQGSIESNYLDTKVIFDAIAQDNNFNKYNFIANAGDMVDNGKNFMQWSFALDTMVEYYANTTIFMCAGNHEDGANVFTNFLPQTAPDNAKDQDKIDGLYYSFNYGNTHFTILNTNDADGKNGLGTTQLNWLKNDLETDNKSTWKIVVLHKSLYSVGSHTNDAEVVKMREQLTKIFADYGVDVVIQGHDHTYSATQFINANGRAMAGAKDKNGYVVDANGVLYMTLGTIGNKYYNYVENESFNNMMDDTRTIDHTLDTKTFSYFKIDGKNLIIQDCIYNKDTQKIDKFGEIKITKEDGEVAKAVEAIKINGETLELNSTILVDYSKRTANLDMTAYIENASKYLAPGEKLQIVNEKGQIVTSLKADTFQKATDFEVQLVKADGTIISLGKITLERKGYNGATAGISVAIVIIILGAIGGIVAGVILSKKKKVATQTESNNDSKDSKEE